MGKIKGKGKGPRTRRVRPKRKQKNRNGGQKSKGNGRVYRPLKSPVHIQLDSVRSMSAIGMNQMMFAQRQTQLMVMNYHYQMYRTMMSMAMNQYGFICGNFMNLAIMQQQQWANAQMLWQFQRQPQRSPLATVTTVNKTSDESESE